MKKSTLRFFACFIAVLIYNNKLSAQACTSFTYCSSAATSTFDDEIFNVSIGTLNNSSTCSSLAGGPGSVLNMYSNYAGVVPSPNLLAGSTYTLSVTVGECNGNSYSGIITAFMDFNQNGSLADPGELVYTSPYTAFAVAGTTFTVAVTIPSSSAIGTTLMRVVAAETSVAQGPCTSYSWGETEDYCVTVVAAAPCSGTPGANSVVASNTAICPSGSVALSLANSYTVGGLTYQWQESATGAAGSFTSVPNATLTSYLPTGITSTTYYQAVITCTNGPASTTATAVQVVPSPNPCACAGYCASGATSTADDEIFNVTIGTLNNSSTCSQTGGPGSTLNEYSNYTGMIAAPALAMGASYNLSVTVGECSGFSYSGGVVAYIDFNQNGLFTDAGELVYSSPSTAFAVAGTVLGGNVTIPTTATPGITRLRVIAVEGMTGQASCGTFSWGETEDYCVNLLVPPACSGAPAANSVVASATTICPSGSVALSLASSYTIGGLTYQWQASPTGAAGSFTSIPSATLITYSPTGITATTYYQAVITCTNGPASTTATAVQIIPASNPCACTAYCASGATSTGDDEIFSVSIGTMTNSSTCSQTGGAGSIMNRYSNYTGIVAAPTLLPGANYTLGVTVGMCSGFSYSGIITAFIDYNQNGLFTDPGELVYTSAYQSFAVAGTPVSTVITIPATAIAGTTRMRVVEDETSTAQGPCTSYSWGETEDYCVIIGAGTPCSGAPAANNVVATSTAICPSGSVALSLANSYTIGGLTYQWQASSTGVAGSFTSVPSATLTTYSPTGITATTYYQAVITCTNGPASTTATAVQIVPTPNPCSCTSYCASNASSTFDDEIFNVSIGTLNNSSTCSQTGGTGSILNEYSNYTGIVAAPNLTVGVTYTLSMTVGECNGNSYSGVVTAFIDYNGNGLFTDPGETVYASSYSAFAVTGTTFTTAVTIPAGAATGIARMRVVADETSVAPGPCTGYTWGETEDYCINITPAPPCTGASGGTLANANLGACNGSTVEMSSVGTSTGSTISYQWMMSTTPGGPYSNVSGGTGATTPSYTTGALSLGTYYYVLQTTCGSASLTGTSNEGTVTIINPPVVSVSPASNTLCIPGASSVALTGSGATTYTWAPSAGLSSTVGVSVNALPAGTTVYTVTGITSGCGSTATAAIMVSEAPSLLSISASPTVLCSGQSSTLSANGALTSSYTITNIPYAPIPTPSSGVTQLCSSGSTVVPLTTGSLDDGDWINLTMPFNFNFFGNGYNQFAISTNGFMFIGGGAPNTFTGYGSMFPSTFAGRPAIGAIYADLDFSSQGSISYFTTGTSPNQKLVVNWDGQFWSVTGTVSTQAILYEGSNVIEVHTYTSTGWNPATQGIQDGAGTTAFVVSGRNATTFTVNSDAYRWEPNGGPISYNWSPATFLSSTTVSNPIALGMTSTSYSVSLTAVNGCTNVGVQNITVNPTPSIVVTPSTTAICVGTSATLTASGATSYTWSSGTMSATTVETPTANTTYSVTGDALGCSSTETVAVTIAPPPTVMISASSTALCIGSSVTLTASGATTYTWSTGAMTASTVDSPTLNTTYTVTGDASGCTGTGTIGITVSASPTVTAMNTPTMLCAGQTATLFAGGATSYTWSTGANASGILVSPTVTTNYTVTGDNGGCTGSAVITQSVSVCSGIQALGINAEIELYPNPTESMLHILVPDVSGEVKFELYDAIGRKVMEMQLKENHTILNMIELPGGVYTYRIKSGESLYKQGRLVRD